MGVPLRLQGGLPLSASHAVYPVGVSGTAAIHRQPINIRRFALWLAIAAGRLINSSCPAKTVHLAQDRNFYLLFCVPHYSVLHLHAWPAGYFAHFHIVFIYIFIIQTILPVLRNRGRPGYFNQVPYRGGITPHGNIFI